VGGLVEHGLGAFPNHQVWVGINHPVSANTNHQVRANAHHLATANPNHHARAIANHLITAIERQTPSPWSGTCTCRGLASSSLVHGITSFSHFYSL